jgi:DNA-binding NtrC family response regulator
LLCKHLRAIIEVVTGVVGPGVTEASMAKRVLVVDDEQAILTWFRRTLEGPEAEVDVAQTIEDAEALLATRDYWLVIADLRLTGVLGEEGLELVRFVRESKPQTHVILVTGYGSPKIREQALAAGAAYYFEKPVQTKALRAALAELP